MLHGVGDRFAGQEVGVGLDIVGQPRQRVRIDAHRDRQTRSRDQRVQRTGQPAVPEDRGVDPLGGLTQPGKHPVDLLGEVVEDLVGAFRFLAHRLAAEPDVQAQHHQLALDAVVQVAGQLPTCLVLGAQGAPSGQLERGCLTLDQCHLAPQPRAHVLQGRRERADLVGARDLELGIEVAVGDP